MASKALLRDAGVSSGLLSQVQFEVVPAKGALRKVLRNLSPESRISISCSPTNGIVPTLRLHKRLTGKGYRPIPHVTARTIKSREHLREVMDALADTDTRGIMALGGDPDPPWGPYDSSFALLREIADMGSRFEFVGIAGYPQTHPVVPDDSLMLALTDKQPLRHPRRHPNVLRRPCHAGMGRENPRQGSFPADFHRSSLADERSAAPGAGSDLRSVGRPAFPKVQTWHRWPVSKALLHPRQAAIETEQPQERTRPWVRRRPRIYLQSGRTGPPLGRPAIGADGTACGGAVGATARSRQLP